MAPRLYALSRDHRLKRPRDRPGHKRRRLAGVGSQECWGWRQAAKCMAFPGGSVPRAGRTPTHTQAAQCGHLYEFFERRWKCEFLHETPGYLNAGKEFNVFKPLSRPQSNCVGSEPPRWQVGSGRLLPSATSEGWGPGPVHAACPSEAQRITRRE